MWLDTVSADELIEAGIGFTIQEEDTPLENFRELITTDTEMGEGPGLDTIGCYWTTSGEHPVTHDQAYQADMLRSAGGWSDIDPTTEEDYDVRNGMDHYYDKAVLKTEPYTPQDRGSDFCLYLAHCKQERELRTVRLKAYLNYRANKHTVVKTKYGRTVLTTRQKLSSTWQGICNQYIASVKHCAKYNHFTNVALTKEQFQALKDYKNNLLEEKTSTVKQAEPVKTIIIDPIEVKVQPSELKEETSITEIERRNQLNWVPVVEQAILNMGSMERLAEYCELATVATIKSWLKGTMPRHLAYQNRLLEVAGHKL